MLAPFALPHSNDVHGVYVTATYSKTEPDPDQLPLGRTPVCGTAAKGEIVADKMHHVLDQMPEYRYLIRERMRVNQEFLLLCEDFGEAFEALQHWKVSTDVRQAKRVEEFRGLVDDLAAEILAVLGVR
jgi:hypothetical protein